MNDSTNQIINDAIWICKSLFDRGKASGSAANISFMSEGVVYITCSGSCFGRLTENSFCAIDRETEEVLSKGKVPSKELPLHLIFYRQHPDVRAVIHTHSPHATWWTFQSDLNRLDAVPPVTPYLKMCAGNVAMIPYEQPGSKELFDVAREYIAASKCCLMERHGAIVGAETIWKAFFCLEELEETTKILYLLNRER